MNQYEASLFNIEHTCKNAIDHDDYEDLKDMPPCCRKAMACEKEKKHKESGCTKKEKKFFKANLKYLEIKKSELVDIQWVMPFLPKINKGFISTKPSIAHQLSYVNYRPPPQYFGRNLLNFIQVYRC
jgi:replication initiation and membrane attachment protein DnaB